MTAYIMTAANFSQDFSGLGCDVIHHFRLQAMLKPPPSMFGAVVVAKFLNNANNGTQGRECVPSDSAPRASSCQCVEQRALPYVRRADEADVGE